MGSIQVEQDIPNHPQREFTDTLPTDQKNGDAFRSFQIIGLETSKTTSHTSMKVEIVLLSWLLVLLRTREGGQVSFEWRDNSDDNALDITAISRRLSTDEVIGDLQSEVGDILATVSRHIPTAPYGSLLLSTGGLSQPPQQTQEKDVLYLEVRLSDILLEIRPVWHTEHMLPYTVTRHIETLADTIQMCISNPMMSIQDLLRPTTSDMDEIWRLNHLLPPTYNFCMHEMVTERAQKHPDAIGIASWDGDLTYGQIELYSTHLAGQLRDMGVEVGTTVPVCFEKSRWTIVAVLAVMKAGATFVLMDPTLPLARLQNMAEQVGANTMVSSRMQHSLAHSILPQGTFFTVDDNSFVGLSNPDITLNLSLVPASTTMYIIFTSGSTGTPKGVKVSHKAYTSSAIPRAKAVGYTENSRVLDFASYAFDVSIDSMLLTLGNGGCLCIPSDEDRLNDINGAIQKMQVNYAGLTPSVGRILDPEVIASLDGLGLGGETVSARDVTLWGKVTRIIIGYGPCECTIGCTVNSSAATGRDYISIGPGNGAAIWIVDPNDHESLMPVGAVGEVLVEGPIVGEGYLNDPDKTAAAFIHDPKWLNAGHKGYPGRQGRLYKTGDLGKYDPDGSGGIVFAGRKDTQVKLRGQRVELGEIESQLKARLPTEVSIVAEVIVPKGASGQPTLVAFIAVNSNRGHAQTDELTTNEPTEELRITLSDANEDVSKVLPRYMVPTAYIPVNYIPVLISGKTDRRLLRELGATVDLRELDQGSKNDPARQLSDLEERVRQAWGTILKVDAEGIGPHDNFFALGGDSLAAMKLSSVCREQGLQITVVDTFDNPTLSAMAAIAKVCSQNEQKDTPAFSIISQSVETACLEASQVYGYSQTAIQDIYPCTPTQESLFTFSLKSKKAYVAQRVALIPSQISVEEWKTAWEKVVAENSILRTRLAQLQEPGLQQVILDDCIAWGQSSDLAQYLEDDRNKKMELGHSLARYAIINHADDGKRYMVWTVHHVLYDGWSEPRILQQISNALQGHPIKEQAQMRDFVKYVKDTDETAMQEFWRRELKGAVGPQFPRLPSRDFLPTPDAMIEHQFFLKPNSGSPFTMATLVRAAWALVASQYTGSDDVVFGETLTGRDIPLHGVEGIVGPLIATVPVRIRIYRERSIESYLQTVQQSMMARTPYQHMGMQNIRKVSQDAQHACEAGTGLVIQPDPEYVGSELGFEKGDVVREALHFNAYPLMVACGIRKEGFRVCANFDSSLIKVTHMERILAQLETACVQLTKDISRRVNEVSCLPTAELNQIWQWNQTPPLSVDESSGKPRADSSINVGSTYPRALNTWVCDLRNESLLSPIGCVGELWLEGDILSGKAVESPAWLVAGSPAYKGRKGKVHSTRDLVHLLEDGSLTFVGRKENVLAVKGHAVDIADLEAHLARFLSPTIRATVAIIKKSVDMHEQLTEAELVVLIEQPACDNDCIEIMRVNHAVGYGEFETTVCARVPVGLVTSLKKLDKFAHDSLPSYMVPSAYVVVGQLPPGTEHTDHSSFNQLAAAIPAEIFNTFRGGLKQAWEEELMQKKLTPAETVLRHSWAKILGISEERIDVDDNFFRLGGDSVSAMKLISTLRAQGHRLTVADIFQHMRLGDAANVLKLNQATKAKVKAYKPFSILSGLEKDLFLSEVVQPKLFDSSWSIQDMYPATDSQILDIRGTVCAPRTSIQYTMLYFNDIDREQLFRACNDLVKAHDILRTVFIEYQSTFLQVVIDTLDIPVVTKKADKDLKEFVADLCGNEIESEFPIGSSFLRMFCVEGDAGQNCLVMGLSHALYDGMSLPRLLRDLETLYKGEEIVDSLPFSFYMSHISDGGVQSKAISYWNNLLNGSSLSVLNGVTGQPRDKSVFQTQQVAISQPPEDITTASLLTAAWAVVLSRRLHKSDVTFGSVTSGRIVALDNVENVMGPCYQITPIRVVFNLEWTAMELLEFVQRQIAQSAAHDFLGFERISKQCTQWPSETRFFDSIVHHQDFEDFDTMPFAGGECTVDIMSPHRDAAYPLKVVSFVQRGQMYVGVVGSERDAAFVDTILQELAEAAQNLVSRPFERISLDSEVV